MEKEEEIIGLKQKLQACNKEISELKDYKRRVEAILAHAPAEIYLKDFEGRYLTVNRHLEKTHGLREDEIVGKLPKDVLEPILADHVSKHDIYVLQTGKELYREEMSHLATDDRLHTFYTIKFPVFNSHGEIDGLGAIATDITDQKQAEVRFQELANTIDGIVWEGVAGIDQMRYVSLKVERLLGYPVEDCLNQGFWFNLIHEEDRPKVIEECRKCWNSESDHYDLEYRVRARDGREIWLRDQVSVTRELGKPPKLHGIMVDITRQREIELAKKTAESQFHTMFISAPFGMVLADRATDASLEINPAFARIVGRSVEEIKRIGWLTIINPGELKDELKNLSPMKAGETPGLKIVKSYVRPDNSSVWCEITVNPIGDESISDRSQYLVILEDITVRKKAEERLSHQASHDSLTGLINRNEFERRAERLISESQPTKSEHALCFMDLDQFKVINDTCGHTAGDELLRQLSQVLQGAVRHRDTLARLGGDEFGVLVEHCSLDHAQRIAKALQQAVQSFEFFWEDQQFRVGVSIGLVAVSETTPSLSELMKQADAACYMAKDLGRNRIHVYRPEDKELAQRHGEMQWVARINQALEEGRFCLYAQSIAPLENRSKSHYEILVRMINDKGEIIPPGAFLPAAERYNLIGKLDRWVVEHAIDLLTDNPAFVDNIHFVSINLSGQSMTDSDFLDYILSLLKTSGIAAEKICFEVTETVAISNLSAAKTFITILKETGCHFALDDFGSGLSSFGYLKNLPVDYLKIDGMFVRDIVDDPIDLAIVRSINDVGQVLGMKTIAEFAESDETVEILREIGVNYAQGYSIGRPLPVEEFINPSTFVVD